MTRSKSAPAEPLRASQRLRQQLARASDMSYSSRPLGEMSGNVRRFNYLIVTPRTDA
ncbi:MAG: hypothetical protein KME26_22710 [Oscillatoria princeps RMCB-10]|nr:hypothetical protein [Oscillatoria princeps RMCB-10]